MSENEMLPNPYVETLRQENAKLREQVVALGLEQLIPRKAEMNAGINSALLEENEKLRARVEMLEGVIKGAIEFLKNKPTYTGHRTNQRWRLEESLKESEVPDE